MNKILIGVIVLMAALWGGAFGLSNVPYSDWKHAPIFFTASFFAIVGVVSLIKGLIELEGK